MMNPHKITAEFEKALCDYTGAPYAVAVDNCSNALFLALYYELKVRGEYKGVSEVFEDGQSLQFGRPIITIPKHTYMSVPNEIVHAGGKVEFEDNSKFGFKDTHIEGGYFLRPTRAIDSACNFTSDMFVPNTHICLSFTGPFKHLKLGKGGAILTDDLNAYAWFKRARFSSRHECSYHEDDFDAWAPGLQPVAGWNFYMPIETAARGLHMMPQFYDIDGNPKHNKPLSLPYPDLSKFKLWQ